MIDPCKYTVDKDTGELLWETKPEDGSYQWNVRILWFISCLYHLAIRHMKSANGPSIWLLPMVNSLQVKCERITTVQEFWHQLWETVAEGRTSAERKLADSIDDGTFLH